MNLSSSHQTVFLNETISLLQIKPNGTYVDCTFGRGGHSALICEHLQTTGALICIDRDISAIQFGKQRFLESKNVYFFQDNFKNLDTILKTLSIDEVDGFIFDLGVSSPQFDDLDRGFSFRGENQLDMRMDQSQTKNAFNIVNQYPLESLASIFKQYGECKHAYSVAKGIVKARETAQIKTTSELVEIIKQNIPTHLIYAQKHPARTYFQALRIEVNDEFESIKIALTKALALLKEKARIIVLTFHSLEDKLVKDILRPYTKSKLPEYLPLTKEMNDVKYKFIKAPQISSEELANNKRARSARMHIIERN